MENVYTISVHGIGTPHSHYILQTRLNNSYNITHLVFTFDWTKLTLASVAKKLDKFIDMCVPRGKKVVLIGHSAGGRVILHSKHRSVIGLIAIAAPLGGSFFLTLFKKPAVWWYGPLIGELAKPHGFLGKPLITITAAYFCGFDGRMFESSMHHLEEIDTFKLNWSWHSGRQVYNDETIKYIISSISTFLKN